MAASAAQRRRHRFCRGTAWVGCKIRCPLVQVLLQIVSADSLRYYSHVCGGTLISGYWVMTPAHSLSV